MGWSYASPSLADPSGSSAVATAVQWLQGTLLGTAATSIAVISVAGIGLMMLSGRVDLRRGAGVIVGCFILLGAPAIAAGIQSMAQGASEQPAPVYWAPPQPVASQVAPAPMSPPPAQSDPFAGAAVPNR
ncbi:MAG TPA: TrbC/VirB2 family protein [Allosphingosinicella sp.]|jgi:type IV secretory pathway VirB2 component (pilin)|nr:TrbC/VirB2 family protein [Allosphingosinicella sp.]